MASSVGGKNYQGYNDQYVKEFNNDDGYKFDNVFLWGPYSAGNAGLDTTFYKMSKSDKYSYLIADVERPKSLLELCQKDGADDRIK